MVETTAKRFKIDGTSDTDFSPDGYVSRAVFSRILIKVAQVREFYTYNGWAQDVSRRFWGAPYIETAKQMGLLPKHWTDGTRFFPYRPVTRAEVAHALTVLPDIHARMATLRPKIDIDDANKVVRYRDPNYRLRQVKKSVKDTVEEVSDTAESVASNVGAVAQVAIETGQSSAELAIEKTEKNSRKILGSAFGYARNAVRASKEWVIGLAPEPKEDDDMTTVAAEVPSVAPTVVPKEPVRAPEPVLATVSPAADDAVKDDLVYTIEYGDTLPKISKRFTGKYKHWETIADYNRIPITRIQTESGESLRVNIIVGRSIKIPGSLLN